MAARRPFWKWHRWKSIGFCLWPPSTCIWNLKLKFQSKLDLCSGNHVVYRQTDRQTDRRTDRRTRWIQYTPPPTSLGGGITMHLDKHLDKQFISKKQQYACCPIYQIIPTEWICSCQNVRQLIGCFSPCWPRMWKMFYSDTPLYVGQTTHVYE